MSFLYKTTTCCAILILGRNALLFLDKTFADKEILPQQEIRYYHTDHSALCADGITMYGKCSRKNDK